MTNFLNRVDNFFGITAYETEPFPNSQDEQIIRGLGWAIAGVVVLLTICSSVLLGGLLTSL